MTGNGKPVISGSPVLKEKIVGLHPKNIIRRN
jgi:hypothetical protein